MSERTSPSTAARHAALPADYGSNPSAAEEAVLAQWRVEGTFESLQASRADAAPFVFWEGPPTANGRPGIHHVLARTLKDTVCRWQSMRGKRVDRKAGWDTHGLPVELEVEKQLGISGKPQIESYGVAAFNQKCRESVWKYKDEWERLSERIGFWLDYAHPYVTYDPRYVDSVWHVLARMHAKGLVYRGKRVLPYCGRCGTGLSSHELGQPGVYQDVNDPSVVVRFVLADQHGAERESLLAWTTTPWTLPSNIALAVHPEREYVRARVALPVAKGAEKGSNGYEVVWVVAERAKATLGEFAELGRKRGSELVGTQYVPLFDAHVPSVDPGAWKPEAGASYRVYAAEYVTVEDGTGIVHQAPSYGADDWATAQRNKLAVLQAVGAEGRFVVDVAGVKSGTFFKEADDALMDDLKARGLLFKKAREPHSYPHCWRCSTPLFYFAAPAWFVRTTALKERMLELNRQVRWVPEEVGTSRFGEWLENNVDWNISRDRYWGTPLPFWICDACDHEVAIGGRGELTQLLGLQPASGAQRTAIAAQDFDPHRPFVDEAHFACAKCGGGTMRRTAAVLDCWFDSGAMPYAQHGYPHVPGSAERLRDQFPAAFICEGLDQTRGWFYTLHAIGAFMTLDQPELGNGPTYKTCLVNGLVLDKDGVKMSKRLGNVVNPWDAIAQHGVDAVRWYLVASAAPWLPKRFDPAALADVQRGFFGTLTNSYKFFQEYARIDRFDPADPAIPPLAARPEIDRWLASRTQSTQAVVRERFDAFDLAGGARALEAFVVDELSNWYIRRNRRRFWKSETATDKLSAFATLHGALESVALSMAPLAPFLSEMLWRRLRPERGSVHVQLASEPVQAALEPDLERGMELVQRIVVMGRALREKAGIKVRQPLRALHVRASDARALDRLRARFASELILDELNIKRWGSLAADDGQLCRITGKANFRVLGKRLGAKMKAAAAAIERLDAVALANLRAGGSAEIVLDGERVELASDDVLVQVESTAAFDVETDGSFVVWLDLELDDELAAEGLARETIIRINALRKESGLAVEDRIELSVAPEGALARRALEIHGAFIRGETLATSLRVVDGSELAHVEPWDLGGTQLLRCVLSRA
ncbi:MAG: isoleucine--tRNA ligase [Planctomycetes bacterium]|nr:isoleucine--tRNA ligase [Planctomycetota bacterium]